MDDLEKYIEKRKKLSPEFANDFETGYNEFKKGQQVCCATNLLLIQIIVNFS